MSRSILFSRYSFLLLLLSAAAAEDEVTVNRGIEAVVVTSPISQGNFLFRAPPAFEEIEAPEGFAVALQAKRGEAKAQIRLRLGNPGAADPETFLRNHEAEYKRGYGDVKRRSDAGRWIVHTTGKGCGRTVLVVFDGTRTYELFIDATPADSELAKKAASVVDGFTILDPKGAPEAVQASPEDLKPSVIEHDYYRLKVHKPAGFSRENVDPNSDKGIFLQLRRQDQHKNLCIIRIRVFLAGSKPLKRGLDKKMQSRLTAFANKYKSPKVPKKPKRTGWRGAQAAYKFKMVGRVPKSGSVIEEDWRVIDHENGRVYEFQVTSYGGASREFAKDIRAFWKKTKIVLK